MTCPHRDIELRNLANKPKSKSAKKRNVTIFEGNANVDNKEPSNSNYHLGSESSNDAYLQYDTIIPWDTEHAQISRAICTLLPSRRTKRRKFYQMLPSNLAHIVTLPRNMETARASPEQVAICLRRQLSSASHNIRLKKTGGRSSRRSHLQSGPYGLADAQDLADTESLGAISDECESIGGHMAAIRDMPVSLDEKRQYSDGLLFNCKVLVSFYLSADLAHKSQGHKKHRTERTKLLQSHDKPLFGINALDLNQYKARKHVKETLKEVLAHLSVWSHSLKRIEGYHGTGVVSYFLFLRWLIFMNILILAIVVTFIIVPNMLTSSQESLHNSNNSYPLKDYSRYTCFENYTSHVHSNTQKAPADKVLDFLQGTGWMEVTHAFIGVYSNEADSPYLWKHYNLPLAYLCATLACFLICLVLMVAYTAEGFRETLLNRSHFHQYCNMVFSGWDYCISEEKSAQLKHSSIAQELKSHLAAEQRKAELARWSRAKKASVFMIRTCVNVVVLVILASSLALIIFVAKVSVEYKADGDRKATEGFKGLVMEFLPSITISGLNFVVPFLYNMMVGFENYSTDTRIKVSLARTVLLRMASILVLLISFYNQITGNNSSNHDCWETYVGQQMYKLAIFDFLIVCGTTFFAEFPRMLLVKHWVNKFTKFIGFQEFDIPNNVLHIVYSQTICWLGMFYCPFLPLISVIKYIAFFYLRKFSLSINCRPSQNAYRASRSNTIFTLVLMFAFMISVVPLGVSMGVLYPSNCCGPFRSRTLMWESVTDQVETWPEPIKQIKDFFFSTGFGVAAFIGLSLVIYYYSTVSAAREERIRVLKEQLILEGKDKQFLLQRVTERQAMKAIT